MSGEQPIAYWDTSIFLAWLNGEPRPKDELDGIREQQQLLDEGEMQLVTSVVTMTEVLESQVRPADYEKFQRLFQRRNFHLVDMGRRIAIFAHDIRDYYRNLNDSLPTVSTPDAII